MIQIAQYSRRRYSCGYLTWGNFFMLSVLIAIVYYCWPTIMDLIGQPQGQGNFRDSIKKFGDKALSFVKSIPGMINGQKSSSHANYQYTQGATSGMFDHDSGDDDEDVGKGKSQNAMDYNDSDDG